MWITFSFYSIGQLCSFLNSASLLMESIRLICFVYALKFYGHLLLISDVHISVINTIVAMLWTISMYSSLPRQQQVP